MTSPIGFLSPLPPEGGRFRRDDDFSSPPSRDATPHNNQESPMERTVISQDLAPVRTRDGLSSTPQGPQVPQRRLVLPDPLACRFIEEDPCVSVIEQRCILGGYELYVVEQWACSRQSPTVVITTYTGDEKHCIVVGIVSIPEDQNLWSPRLHLYFKAANQHNSRPKETGLGELMITNLSSFPSALTVIPVPDGDVRKHRQVFFVNENLKRLGCSGRSGLALTDPTEATQAKFHQLYKTSDRIPILQSVVELVKLCQVALYMFEKLDHQYIDGLLCDVTEKAINNWWTEVGAEHYNFEPTDGILGPCTVSALLGMLMGARNRLHWYGAPVSKDVFEIDCTKRGVAYFQKQQKLEKTRRLDRQTVFRLHTATAKGAAAEGWGVQKAVKSTVTEIGGKRGELVIDMVSGKDKGGLADIETVDIDRFVSLVYGDRPRWLWHGKTRRSVADSFGSGDPELGSMFSSGKSEASDAMPKRTHALLLDEELGGRRKEDNSAASYPTYSPGSVSNVADASGERDTLRRGVFKSVADKMSDARSGLGRIKDAVGGNRKGHASKLSVSAKEDFSDGGNGSALLPSASQTSVTTPNPPIARAFTWKNKPEEYLAAIRQGDDVLPSQNDDAQYSGTSARDIKPDEKSGDELLAAGESDNNLSRIGSEIRKGVSHKGFSPAPSVKDDNNLRGPLLEKEQKPCRKQISVARRRSCGIADLTTKHITNESRWPRRMSFSDAEEAILTWEEVIDLTETMDYLTCVEAHAEAASHLNHLIEEIVSDVGPWVEDKIRAVEFLNERYGQDKTELQGIYHRLNEACQRIHYNSDELLSEQRENLTESVKEIEVLLARLEYEINGLSQKVADVEDSIQNFERQVDDVESRAAELKVTLETESWPHWFVRTLTGIGTGPNITREP
ncbi:hypothetical protein H634G_09160 [Metarhizium anisopliae BRIP 53293]|uniref:STB6-like N-terminal domain-containing protein n=1 Tax=Metarhizium anisopliae BRIP 53293 TaxID=1291518 RepID=A0A0D9NPH7_METAN|nr:hypothetical protein H634G_09160 [Metarhizium anisopliae BRIP 53293]KJK91314.1 hypothetical protein H633G_04864 [Metarhizium anisopliae BRIP 53284]